MITVSTGLLANVFIPIFYIFVRADWACQDYSGEANMGGFVVLDSHLRTVHIAYYTLKGVKKGHELRTSWGNNAWESIAQIMLNGQAQTSFWYHRLQKLLLKLCKLAGICSEDESAEAAAIRLNPSLDLEIEQLRQEHIFFDPDNRGRFGICDYVRGRDIRDDDEKWTEDIPKSSLPGCKKRGSDFLGPRLEPETAFQRVDTAEAFLLSGCDRMLPSEQGGAGLFDLSRLSNTTKKKLQKLEQHRLRSKPGSFGIPVTNNRELEILREVNIKVYVAFVKDTFHPARCIINALNRLFLGLNLLVPSLFMEVLTYSVSCRWFTRPDKPAMALIAAEKIKRGEAVICYAGKMWEEEDCVQNAPAGTDHYAYSIDTSLMRFSTDLAVKWDGPQLLVESRCWLLADSMQCFFL